MWDSHHAPSYYLPEAHAELRIPAAAAKMVGVERLDIMTDGGEDCSLQSELVSFFVFFLLLFLCQFLELLELCVIEIMCLTCFICLSKPLPDREEHRNPSVLPSLGAMRHSPNVRNAERDQTYIHSICNSEKKKE